MATASKTGPRPSDKWIPWYFALFFVLMISVLGPMAWLAVHTMPGVVTENAYEKGLAYNKAIAAGVQAQNLGWHGDLSIDTDAATLQSKAVYTVRDARGQPIADATVHLWLTRPAQNGLDRDTEMKSAGNGHYEASVMLPAHGVWDARAAATRGGDNFQTEKRIVAP